MIDVCPAGCNAELEMKAAHSVRKPFYPIKTTTDTDMMDITTSFGFRCNGVKFYDASSNFEGSLAELVRHLRFMFPRDPV